MEINITRHYRSTNFTILFHNFVSQYILSGKYTAGLKQIIVEDVLLEAAG